MSKVLTKVGDLFCIPLEQERLGVGVVAAKWKDELYLVLFAETVASELEAASLRTEDLTPVFASSSLDAKLWHGHWPIVKRGVNVSEVSQPFYKVSEPSGFVAESFDRSLRTHIGSEVAARLAVRTCIAPIRLENALKAFHGISDWSPIFDNLRFDRVGDSIRAVT